MPVKNMSLEWGSNIIWTPKNRITCIWVPPAKSIGSTLHLRASDYKLDQMDDKIEGFENDMSCQ